MAFFLYPAPVNNYQRAHTLPPSCVTKSEIKGGGTFKKPIYQLFSLKETQKRACTG